MESVNFRNLDHEASFRKQSFSSCRASAELLFRNYEIRGNRGATERRRRNLEMDVGRPN
jgi:hypothetical protein